MADVAGAMNRVPAMPPHVPQELVIEFDFFSDPRYAYDPFSVVQDLPTGPRIFYSPTHYALPGNWVLTRADDIRYVLQHPELFSSTGSTGISALVDEDWGLVPLDTDPPEHMRYRSLLNPLFSPKEVARLDEGVQAVANRVIGSLAGKREVEFVSAFAQPFPVSVFLQLLDLPLDEMPQFLAWEFGLLKSFKLEDRRAAARGIVDYLRARIDERRGGSGTDLITRTANLLLDGRPLTDDEVLGVCMLFYVAGLDTVASSLGFYFHHLAAHPELQAQLRADRSLIPTAVEEFLRLYSVASAHRRVVQDTELAGVTLKTGDWIMVPMYNASRDPAEFERPNEFVLDRSSNRHNAFAYGPHRCLGSHLARREFIVAMNGIFDRLPPFRLKEGAPFRTVGGVVFGVEEMHLVFDH